MENMHNGMALACDQNCWKVCAVYMKKTKYKTTDNVLKWIKTYFIENFEVQDACLPCGICGKGCSDLI